MHFKNCIAIFTHQSRLQFTSRRISSPRPGKAPCVEFRIGTSIYLVGIMAYFTVGHSVFWIKFFPALFGALTLAAVWKGIEVLGGNLYALVLGALAVTLSVIMRINILYQPNSFDILCWTFLCFSFIKYISSNNNKWLWIAAITFAIGFLNKYNIVFLLLGFLPAILLTRHRTIFKNPQFYLAVALSLVLISPNLIWQYQNNFPVVHH